MQATATAPSSAAKPARRPLTKISVKIWRPLADALDAKLDTACLRRDAYLAKLLAGEMQRLDAEVSLPNSPTAHAFVADRLDALDRKLVSIALDPKIAEQLHAICARKNIVRDAFFNRLYLLLAASPKRIDQLLFPDEPKWRTAVWSEYKHDGPFFESGFYPLSEPADPFWAIRAGLELFYPASGAEDYEVPGLGTRVKVVRGAGGQPEPVPALHNILFDQKVEGGFDLLGLNCYVADWCIPGHEAQRRHAKALDELLESLK
jgi:hypothetical protein